MPRPSSSTLGEILRIGKRSCWTRAEKLKSFCDFDDPIRRTVRIVKNDMKNLCERFKLLMGMKATILNSSQFIPTHTDLLIIGDGVLGSSIAHWLKQRAPRAFDIIVIGQGKQFHHVTSEGELTQNFTQPESIKMSQFCSDFLKTTNIPYNPHGHLVLANESTANNLITSFKIRQEMGNRCVLLTKQKIIEKFPWINADGIEIGCIGLENEGWFDSKKLLNNLQMKNMLLGVQQINGEIIGFNFKQQDEIIVPFLNEPYQQLDQIVIELPDNRLHGIKFAYCILAADDGLIDVAEMAKIGKGDGFLSIPLPFIKRKQFTHYVDCKQDKSMPLITDYSGFQIRPNGFNGFAVKSDKQFQEIKRIQGMKLQYSEKISKQFNPIDGNGIIGTHPVYHNLYLACGFDTQHAPAIGRAVMELILDGEYKTINLSRFGFERIIVN